MRPFSQWVCETILSIPSTFREWMAMYQFRQIRRGWKRTSYRSGFHDWLLWCMCVGIMLFPTLAIVVYVPPLSLFKILAALYLAPRSPSLTEIASVGLWVLYGVLLSAVFHRKRFKQVGRFFELHAFDHLYDRCRTLSPAQKNRARLSQATLLHPASFSYAFSGPVMVVRVRTREEHRAHLLSEIQPPQSTVVSPDLLEPRVESEQSSPVLEGSMVIAEQQKAQASLTEDRDEESAVTAILSATAEPQTAHRETVSQELSVAASQTKREAIVSWQQVQALCTFQIVIGQTVSFYLLEEAGTRSTEAARTIRREIFLNNTTYQAIIVYLATREKGRWIARNDLLDAVYGDATKEIAEEFNDHMRKIRNAINGQVMKAFPLLPPVQKQRTKGTGKEDGFELFENKVERKKDSYYRLNARIRVTGTHDLLKWYQRIRADAVRPSQEPLAAGYTIEALQNLKELLIGRYSKNYLQKRGHEEGYSGGYLIQCISEDPFRRWARDFFKETRTMYISVLKYIASCEEKMCMQTQKSEWARSAAELYKECAYAATCDPIDSAQGEDALRKSIEWYMHVQGEYDRHEEARLAQEVYDTYKRRVERAVSQWMPEQKTREVLQRYLLVQE